VAGEQAVGPGAGGGAGEAARRALAAVLFLQASTNAMDAFSALNSSPWTAENFGATETKAKSCREYVLHAIAVTAFYGIAAAAIARSLWPIIGTLIADVYLWWLYSRALKRGRETASTGWATGATA
jgi:hypothetical protein